MGYYFRLTARFFYMHHPTDSIAHTTAFVTPVMEHWLEWEIYCSVLQSLLTHTICSGQCFNFILVPHTLSILPMLFPHNCCTCSALPVPSMALNSTFKPKLSYIFHLFLINIHQILNTAFTRIPCRVWFGPVICRKINIYIKWNHYKYKTPVFDFKKKSPKTQPCHL